MMRYLLIPVVLFAAACGSAEPEEAPPPPAPSYPKVSLEPTAAKIDAVIDLLADKDKPHPATAEETALYEYALDIKSRKMVIGELTKAANDPRAEVRGHIAR